MTSIVTEDTLVWCREFNPKFDDRVEKCIERSRALRLQTHKKNAATDLQKAIRGEYAASTENVPAVSFDNVTGQYEVIEMYAPLGSCVCVTCADVDDWRNMDAGHFLSRKHTSILFDERQIHPQCRSCNDHGSGNRNAYNVFMRAVYGQGVIDELERRKNQSYQPTREELCQIRVSSAIRLKIARMTLEGIDVAKTARRKRVSKKKVSQRQPDAQGQAYLPDEDGSDGTMAPERIKSLDTALEKYLEAKHTIAECREVMAEQNEAIVDLFQEHEVKGTYRIDFGGQTFDFSIVMGTKVRHNKVKIVD